MMNGFNSLQVLGVTTVSAVLLLAGCSAGQGGVGMMGGDAKSSGGMMGGNQGYHYSRPSCSAPAVLPGATVRVGLTDMGMTRMMGGVAPMGSQMRLNVAPGSASAGSVAFVASNMG